MKEFLKKLGRNVTGRKGIGNTLTVVIIIAVIMLNVLAYTVTNAFNLYLYSPKTYDFSLSGNTDALFDNAIKAGKKVQITFCYTEEMLKTHSTGSLVLETARQFEEHYSESGFINLKFVNLLTKMDNDDNPAHLERYCNVVCQNDIDPDEDITKICKNTMRYVDVGRDDNGNPICTSCRKAIDLNKDIVYNFAQNSIIFETGTYGESSYSYRVLTDRSTAAGFVDFYTLNASGNVVAYNGEEVMAAMISWVLQKDHPVAYFTQNHGETADIAFTNLLTCAGYYVEVINLRKMEIPENAGMVIISNPTSDFDRSSDESNVRGELNKIEAYLEGGGKLYVALDPYVKKLNNLEGMLEKWGISLSGEYNEDNVLVRDIVKEDSNAITPDGYTFIATHADNEIANKVRDKVTTYGNDSILISEVTRLKLDASKGAQPLLISSNTSSTYAGGKQTDDSGEYPVVAYSVKEEKNDKKSTVLVIPTAYITAADALLSDSYSNKDFLYSTLEVVFGSNSAPRGCNMVDYTAPILENLTMGKARLYTAIILAIPAALAVVGAITIIRRKNR